MDGVDDPLDLSSLTVSSDYVFLKCCFLQTLLDATGSALSGISFTGFVLFREDMAFDFSQAKPLAGSPNHPPANLSLLRAYAGWALQNVQYPIYHLQRKYHGPTFLALPGLWRDQLAAQTI